MPESTRDDELATAVPGAAERTQFDRDGFLIIRGALTPGEVGHHGWLKERDLLDPDSPPLRPS